MKHNINTVSKKIRRRHIPEKYKNRLRQYSILLTLIDIAKQQDIPVNIMRLHSIIFFLQSVYKIDLGYKYSSLGHNSIYSLKLEEDINTLCALNAIKLTTTPTNVTYNIMPYAAHILKQYKITDHIKEVLSSIVNILSHITHAQFMIVVKTIYLDRRKLLTDDKIINFIWQ